jgi:predicted dehydrogenase
MDRRTFVKMIGGTTIAATSGGLVRAKSANDKLLVGVMGLGGRGTTLATRFAAHENTEVIYAADVDKERASMASLAIAKVPGVKTPPKPIQDFRQILDDKTVDVLVIATCNHWHAPAAILGCSAGKHIYVEKPCSHNAWEGETMVAAARKFDRRVQMGNQRRTWPKIVEAIGLLHEGVIGRVYYAAAFYNNNRPSIGVGKPAPVPANIDYELWQGPAPRKPFRDNYLHYNWHWFWHWGNGELGNNGVHTLDVCRWGLGVDYPTHVTSTGGRYRFQDDQETPDTNVVAFTFPGGKTASWEGLSCNRKPNPTNAPSGEVTFHGEKGSLAISGGGYAIYDEKGKEVRKATGPASEIEHTGNLLDAIRTGAKLNSEIKEGHKSTLLCHLGNIAYRTGRSLHVDPKNGHIVGDDDAMKLWKRQYESGWEPKI